MTQRWADTLFQPTQWYPRVAVYDDLRGWDTSLYLGPSEFYNNLRPVRREHRRARRMDRERHGRAPEPEEVLDRNARERSRSVLELRST
jgi:hypothetical protein